MSLVIRGPVFTGGKVIETGVRVEDGVIVDISDRDLGPADQVVTLGPRQLLLPAGVELLTALRDWGEAPKDTVETVTRAALAAGVTVACDQSNTVPRINTPELARRRWDYVAERSYVDFGVTAHPPVEPERIAEYREAGVHCVCVFMWDVGPWNTPRDTDDVPAMFQRIAAHDLPAQIFVDELAWQQTSLWPEGEARALQGHLRRLHPDLRARLSITQPGSVDAIRAAKDRLPNLLVQTPVHSVLMPREIAYERIGSAAFVVPPLRTSEEVDRMREYAENGQIDILVSHHAGHRFEDKYSSAAPVPGELTPKAGFSAMDYTYVLLLSRLGIAAACRGYAENPARHLGLKKGLIAKGYDADFAVVEEDAGVVETNMHVSGGLTPGVWKVAPGEFQSKAKVTPFVGERLKYRVTKTFLRGEEAYDAATATFTRRPVRRVA